MIQLTLTLKMTTAQVFETSVTVNNNIPIEDYVHPDDQTQPTFEVNTISLNRPIIMDIITILALTRLRICAVNFRLTLRDRLS